MRGRIIKLVAIPLLWACGNEENEFDLFIIGDINQSEINYFELIPPISRTLTTSSNFITSDTIKLDIDSDDAVEFSFVITQNFNEAGIILKQEIMILVSENIQLQLHKALSGSENYVHTSKLMDQISRQGKWYYLTKYSLTSIQGNFITAPRENPLYLAFKYKENSLGWIKLTFLLNNLRMVKEFQINEYAYEIQ